MLCDNVHPTVSDQWRRSYISMLLFQFKIGLNICLRNKELWIKLDAVCLLLEQITICAGYLLDTSKIIENGTTSSDLLLQLDISDFW